MTLPGTISVVLADDHAMVRHALAQILQESGCLRVVGQAANGPETLDSVAKNRPEVLVLDYTMPELDTPRAIESLLRRWPESGALAYVVKSAAVEELVEAIKSVMAGQIYISPKVSLKVIQHLRRPKKDRVGLEALSQREFELLRILGAGMGIKECAKQLKISTSSVSTYRSRLMEKLNLHTTAEIIRFALENDIVG